MSYPARRQTEPAYRLRRARRRARNMLHDTPLDLTDAVIILVVALVVAALVLAFVVRSSVTHTSSPVVQTVHGPALS